MRSFMYTIRQPVRLHARHAGQLVKETRDLQSEVTMRCGERSADAKRVLALMGLGVKQGEVIELTIEGPDEDAAFTRLHRFVWNNF